MPTSIDLHALVHQRSTNAKVLCYLLQPENNHYVPTWWNNGKRRTAYELLELIVAHEFDLRVLIDVGAQMLELKNHELAMAWVQLKPDAQAAIYFDDHDQLTVYTRSGTVQPFIKSPYLQQLDRCVVYLDDAHTRGTDIRFPPSFRAAVTLGPRVTKDRLVQGIFIFITFFPFWLIC